MYTPRFLALGFFAAGLMFARDAAATFQVTG